MTDTMKMTSYKLEWDDVDTLNDYCREHGVTKAAVLTMLIRSLEDQGPQFLERVLAEQNRRHRQSVERRIETWENK